MQITRIKITKGSLERDYPLLLSKGKCTKCNCSFNGNLVEAMMFLQINYPKIQTSTKYITKEEIFLIKIL